MSKFEVGQRVIHNRAGYCQRGTIGMVSSPGDEVLFDPDVGEIGNRACWVPASSCVPEDPFDAAVKRAEDEFVRATNWLYGVTTVPVGLAPITKCNVDHAKLEQAASDAMRLRDENRDLLVENAKLRRELERAKRGGR